MLVTKFQYFIFFLRFWPESYNSSQILSWDFSEVWKWARCCRTFSACRKKWIPPMPHRELYYRVPHLFPCEHSALPGRWHCCDSNANEDTSVQHTDKLESTSTVSLLLHRRSHRLFWTWVCVWNHAVSVRVCEVEWPVFIVKAAETPCREGNSAGSLRLY